MKYFLMCAALLACTYILSSLVIRGIAKAKKNHLITTKKRRMARILLWLALLVLCAVGYLGVYNHSDPEAKEYLNRPGEVSVTQIKDGYVFDGPGNGTALIFYPGAKVATEAYVPLLYHLAEEGMDTFLIDMPFHMAFFHSNAAKEIIGTYDYSRWILGGHSLGGVAAALYANANPDQVDGLALLAAYPTKKLDDNLSFLSVYGSRDTVLNRDAYEKSKANWPADGKEVCIEGGNHAQFGNYGFQKGDSAASVSAKEQQQETIRAVLDMFLQDANDRKS